MASTPRTWLITGTSSGFGMELAKVVASKGDLVIATSRSPNPSTHPLAKTYSISLAPLDHNQSLDKIKSSIDSIVDKHGIPDIVFNNAAYVQQGLLEEASPEDTIQQYQSNVFGPLNVYRAIMPYLRKKGTGTLVTNGSMGAWMTLTGGNLYMSTKAALRNLMMGFAEEIKPFGIKHLLVEPGFFRTALLKPGSNISEQVGKGNRILGYEGLNKEVEATLEFYNEKQLGDPVKGCEIIFEVITSTGRAEGRELPAWMPLGSDAFQVIANAAQEALKVAKEWEDLAVQSDYPEGE